LLILLFVLSFGFRMQTIGGVAPKAVQAGAYPGDTLLEFNGRPFTGYGVLRDAVLNSPPGGSCRPATSCWHTRTASAKR
jgi:hypothetical protein